MTAKKSEPAKDQKADAVVDEAVKEEVKTAPA